MKDLVPFLRTLPLLAERTAEMPRVVLPPDASVSVGAAAGPGTLTVPDVIDVPSGT